MADTKTAPVQKPAVVKDEQKDATTVEIDPKDVTQAMRVLKFKLSQLQADARRSRPYMSRTTEEAAGRYRAALNTVIELSEYIDQQPSH